MTSEERLSLVKAATFDKDDIIADGAMFQLRKINESYHWCWDWDFLVICDEDKEYECCTCNKPETE